MRDWQARRYWLIGASEGLGAALARQLSRAGVELVLSARNAERLEALARALPGRARVLPMDVRDGAAVAEAAREAQVAGPLDGMIWSAGLYWPMRAQEWDAERAEAMADVNFTGAVRAVGAALPGMLARGEGHIVMIGSLAGFRGLPRAQAYGASKAGVIGLAESLHADLRRSGVQVQLVNPGFVRTRLTDKNDFAMPFLMEPEEAAAAIFEHMTAGGFRRDIPAGFAALFRLARLLPDAAYYRLFG